MHWPAGSPPGVRKATEPDTDDATGSNAHAADLAEGYERLRERVLAGAADGWRLGHAVLASKGMVAWIGAWATLHPPAPAAGTSAPVSTAPTTLPLSTSSSHPCALSSLPHAEQIVAVLAQMALAHA